MSLTREQRQETPVDVERFTSGFRHFKETFRRNRFQIDCRSLAFRDPGADDIADPAIGIYEHQLNEFPRIDLGEALPDTRCCLVQKLVDRVDFAGRPFCGHAGRLQHDEDPRFLCLAYLRILLATA